MILWIGLSVSPQRLKDLLDIEDIATVNPHTVSFIDVRIYSS